MKKRLLIVILLVMGMFVFTGCGATSEESVPVNSGNGENIDSEETPVEENEDNGVEENVVDKLNTSVSVDAGQNEAVFKISLKNTSEAPVKVTFTSGQRYELVVTNVNNEEVYRYSIDKLFIQAIEEMELAAGEEKTWEEAWNYNANDGTRLPAGEYKVTAQVVAKQTNQQELTGTQLTSESSFTIPEANTAFRNVQVMGENGEYIVTGEARVFEGSFFYSVEDGHNYVIKETVMQANEGAPAWSPFEIKLSIPEDKFPENGSLIVHLYERSAKDGAITNSYHARLQQFQ
ncbi:BsuPI-related putative proteinase inhibitor [Fredinandcohnia sp. 179-A 10B2 NHS]|uniref:BsuPI-related putative proteinase inhibitor n=1 Tax=Fredinandcohnia sp. 179-A 10B2 NHS TaxID=3235176 RepID=UPI00399FD70F